jgi:MYXO-CTERM domain-containing protein
VYHPPADPPLDAQIPVAPPPRHVTDPEFDAYDAGVIVFEMPPGEPESRVGCAVTPAPRAGGWALGVLLFLLYALRRGLRASARRA